MTSESGFHESVYDESLLVGDPTHWAFGTGFADPLAGVDTSIPDGVEPTDLATYCLMLGDDALVASHRLSQWCSRAPELEDDIALANIALDLLGQARLLLTRAAAADPGMLPALPEASPVPPEDALAFFRDDRDFRNVRLVEPPHGDFGETVARLALFSTWRLALLERLLESRDPVLAAIAAQGTKEVTYHRDYAARWVLTLARGTAESRRRVLAGLEAVRRYRDELCCDHAVEKAVAAVGVGVRPSVLADEVDEVLEDLFGHCGIDASQVAQVGPVSGGQGRDGRHTEALSRMLAEMQSVARAHPLGRW